MLLVEAAAYAKAHTIAPMSPTTANAYLSRLSTMFKWAVRQWLIERNPAEGLTVAEPEGDPRDARDPFSLDQLRAIFAATRFSQFEGARHPGVVGLLRAWDEASGEVRQQFVIWLRRKRRSSAPA
jgi:hypothetical protein